MADSDLERIERKLDELLELAPIIKALGKVLVRINVAGKQAGLSKDTLHHNDKVKKYQEVGHKRTYVEIGDVSVVKKR